MTAKILKFAPLVRVSSERQSKQGSSLLTQTVELEEAIVDLGGEIHKWYRGHEHASPEFERKIFDLLLADGIARKYDAVIVADVDRWSRDNSRSEEGLKILRENGIRFFEIF
jgi:DNA invertase Pin-like site-specific DNA recombinase